MHLLASVLKYFFIVLGVIFFTLIIAAVVLVVFDPLNLRPVFTGEFDGPAPDAHPALDARQEQALQAVGVDPAKVPTEITPELRDCAVQELGAERVAELEAGAEPTAADLWNARACLQ